jgi:hypothetical protein
VYLPISRTSAQRGSNRHSKHACCERPVAFCRSAHKCRHRAHRNVPDFVQLKTDPQTAARGTGGNP